MRAMYEWPEELQMIRDAVRQFVDNEIRPHREELEHGDLPPYDLLRKLYQTFGMDSMARDCVRTRIEAEKNGTSGRARAAGAVVAASRCCRSSSSASARPAWSPRSACRSG